MYKDRHGMYVFSLVLTRPWSVCWLESGLSCAPFLVSGVYILHRKFLHYGTSSFMHSPILFSEASFLDQLFLRQLRLASDSFVAKGEFVLLILLPSSLIAGITGAFHGT